MNLSDFDFALPPELIAQTPLADRSESRLLHLAPSGEVSHRRFGELVELLAPGDLLVANNTRVLPARLRARLESGGRLELLVLPTETLPESGASDGSEPGHCLWVLARPARKLPAGSRLFVEAHDAGPSTAAVVIAAGREGRRLIRLTSDELPVFEWMERVGTTPLPPYINNEETEEQTRLRYQTVYAKHPGAIAAPTAGLHFTRALIERLERVGIGWEELTLHVGYATFQPMRGPRIEDHQMSIERFDVPSTLVDRIDETRARGGRVIAVGTTVVRALESAASSGRLTPGSGATELFISPGFQFRVLDGLVTNFHLPQSSLLVLVAAFGGLEAVRRAYATAVREGYRFYSYGDAMLIYPARYGASRTA